jgi:hypothetical protein
VEISPQLRLALSGVVAIPPEQPRDVLRAVDSFIG